MSKEYRIGVYIRLSLADEDTGRTKDESDSVGNQRLLINRYLDSQPELSDCPRFEFADDGYSGTNFRRPQFTAMMERVKAGDINLICVKDFSRFSRDYIETGNYLECVFPFLRVRFISINDGYDSNDCKESSAGLEVVMRNIIYASYSKDLSVKTTSAKVQMMKQGKYVGAYGPYGYQMHPTQRNKLTIDPESAGVVRRIFDLALAGTRTSAIAEILNDENIPTPGQYFKSKHPENGKFRTMSEKISWTSAMVYKILVNETYTGAAVGHRRRSAGIGTGKSVAQDRSDWIVVQGAYEAIVTRDEYEAAQSVIQATGKGYKGKGRDYALKGLVHCGNCKRTMAHRIRKTGKGYFCCCYSLRDKDTGCAVGEKYEEADLERIVFSAIVQFMALAEQKNVREQKSSRVKKTAIQRCMAQLKSLQSEADQNKAAKLKWYEKYAAGDICKAEYLNQKIEIDTRLAEVTTAIQRCQEELQELEAQKSGHDNGVNTLCRDFAHIDTLTYDLAHAFVKAVYVYPDNRVEIEWKFQGVFEGS